MIRYGILILALLAPFWFPFPLAILLLVVSSFLFPLSGVVIGVLTDALFYTTGVPIATCIGIVASLVGFFAHRFLKAHIVSV